MGINDEVVAIVGREVRVSVDDDVVQRCATYLRSIAPDGIFESSSTEDKLHTRADAHHTDTHNTSFIDAVSFQAEVESTVTQYH